jgi:hypothetical protein
LPGGNGGGGGPGGPSLNLDASFLTLPDARPQKPDIAKDGKPFGVDDAGNAICLSILSLGTTGTHGDNIDAFQSFMNTYTANSGTGTTSKMTMIQTRTTITADLLNRYNVLVLQRQGDGEYGQFWKYTQEEVDAVKQWVEAGGAIITMSGYGGDPAEVPPLNQLIAFTGISYNQDNTYPNCPDNTCYCHYNTIAFNGWTTDYADYDDLTNNLKSVGQFVGRSLNCDGSDCQIFAKDPKWGNVGIAKKIGKGRILAWGDEWVTYTNQWGLVDDPNASRNTQCTELVPKVLFSVPQFWYNIFRWSVPSMDWCFIITLPPSAPPSQQVIY